MFSTVVSQSSVNSTGDNFVAPDQTKLTLRIWSHNEQDENAAPSLAAEKEIDLTNRTSCKMQWMRLRNRPAKMFKPRS